tara:strand:- start:253 stop:525 length:273 start_codon:yes stop_codon:yes gene_type:complete
MYSFVYKVLDVGTWTTYVWSIVDMINGGSWITPVVLSIITGSYMIYGKLYLPYKKNKRDQETHELDLEEQRLINMKLHLELQDDINEITR